MSAALRGVTGIWSHTIRDRFDEITRESFPHANLRTNSGNDWQALVMGGVSNRGETGTATAVSANSLTNTGAAFPTAANVNGMTGGYAGQIVVMGAVYAVIVSNTGTVLTVDRWVSAGAPFTAAATPAAGVYQILPGKAPAWFLALSSTAITPAAADTTLAGELTSSGFSRAPASTFTHTAASASYSLANTFTATATATINSEAVFNAAGVNGISAANGGIMAFENTEPNPPTLVAGDTLAQTVTVNY